MVKDEKNKIREQQMPGRGFSSGNLTLYQIAESKGAKLGTSISYSDAQILDKDKEILAKAIPANRLEQALFSKKNNSNGKAKVKIERGMVMKHINGTKVTVIETDVDTTPDGKIRHKVIVNGTKNKYLVPENKLEAINGNK